MRHWDVIVIGAGAAGLMCALTAGQRGRTVLLLDHASEPGAKIVISGGGRCNFTNTGTSPDRFISQNPRFCRSALSRYGPSEFVALVRRHGIAFHEKTLGQLFCDGSARQIVSMLVQEAMDAAIELRLGCRVKNVTKPDGFVVATDDGVFGAKNLIIATGGLSIPKMGATGFAYEIARQFEVNVTPTRPGLVPLTFDEDGLTLMRPLAGVSLNVTVAHARQKFQEALLFTHRGLSGPAVLQISSYWRKGEIVFNLLPEHDAFALLLDNKRNRPKTELTTVLTEWLPRRFVLAMDLPAGRLADLPDRTLRSAAAKLNHWIVTPMGTEGYAKAEVTAGGIDTNALSSKTMEVTKTPGLFFIGEAVDVTGWLGGYNFQWAWASGWCAGMAV